MDSIQRSSLWQKRTALALDCKVRALVSVFDKEDLDIRETRATRRAVVRASAAAPAR